MNGFDDFDTQAQCEEYYIDYYEDDTDFLDQEPLDEGPMNEDAYLDYYYEDRHDIGDIEFDC